jgi:hypothetical protein
MHKVSRVVIVVIQVGAVKIYVANKQWKRSGKRKDRMKLSLPPKLGERKDRMKLNVPPKLGEKLVWVPVIFLL